MAANTAESVTLVSCYYKLSQSKHTPQSYDKWINNFLLNIDANIVIFVGKEEKEYITSILAKNNKMNSGSMLCNYVLIEKEITDFALVKKYNNAFWDKQAQIDPGKKCGRGQDCYKIWNSKFSFLQEAIQLNPFNSDKFIWNDIGNIREPSASIVDNCLPNYPLYTNISRDKMDIVFLKPFSNLNQMFFQNEVHFSGSMFGGGKEVLNELCDLFYFYFDVYVNQNLFIGCDQQILATVFMQNPDKFNCIFPINPENVDIWFYLYKHYSSSSTTN
jgi:hypothetical protein